MTLGPLFFAAPWALAVLGALPLLFIILRATPPAPKREFFPPLRLLHGLRTEEESRKRAPLWLVLLRAFAAALMIIGFARPSLAPKQALAGVAGPTLIVVDDGWTSAPNWAQVRAAALDAAAESERAKQEVLVLQTAPSRVVRDAGEALNPADARGLLDRMEPQPWRPDRADAVKRLPKAPARYTRIIWLADGIADQGAEAFAKALMSRGPVTVRLPTRTARAIISASVTSEGIEATIKRGPDAPAQGAITAETLEGRSLGAGEFKFGGAETARTEITLPPEIAARAARARVVGEASAGATRLLSAGTGRPYVGLADSGGVAQPLLSDLYYVERAIAPFASPRRGEIRTLVDSGAQAIILPDTSQIARGDADALDKWLRNGGLLVRFAGPRLANAADQFVPLRLRPGARALGGAMAWEKPQGFAPFAQESPFAGLTPSPEIVINHQVLAEPTAERDARVWARLEDGAPVVTAAARGKGLIVLFHITSGPAWSTLPLSGLYVDMLRRTLAFAGRAQSATAERASTGPWLPDRLLDGYGALAPAGPSAKAISADVFPDAKAGPNTPPGIYERVGSPGATLDTAAANESLSALALPNGVTRMGLEGGRTRQLGGPFLTLAALMIALDLLLALMLAGRLPHLRKPQRLAAALALFVAFTLTPDFARAAPDATLEIHLAYIRTGDSARDRTTQQGLANLGDTLTARTSVEPGDPRGVDPARDDLSPYPVLYWAASAAPQRLSDAAIANLDRYMRLGGLIFLDTRGNPNAASAMLAGIDAPPLQVIGSDHVLSRTFYLLKTYPARSGTARIWAETANAAAARDGVAALMIGDGDWATAWAQTPNYSSEGSWRQREMALRFGVNLVMMALTGNYKTDQVHVPILLQRLGKKSDQ